ncbi:MAG: hypothetical protein ACOYN2_05245 [Patescibacteria group bacterium]
MRAGLGEDGQSKDWKELQKEFNKLAAESRAAILALAQEISAGNQPFHAPVSGQTNYSVDKKSYTAQKIVHATKGQAGSVSKQSSDAPASTLEKAQPAAKTIESAPSKPAQKPAESKVPTSKSEEKNPPEKTPTPSASTPSKVEQKPVTPQKTEKKQSTESADQSEETERSTLLLKSTDAVVFRDGAYYLVGKDGKSKAIQYNNFINKKDEDVAKEATPAQKARMAYVDDLAIFLEAYTAEHPKNAAQAEKIWSLFDEYIMDGKNLANKDIVDILKLDASMARVLEAIFSEKNPKTRRTKLYQAIKDDLGQYDLVPSMIARQRFGHWDEKQV